MFELIIDKKRTLKEKIEQFDKTVEEIKDLVSEIETLESIQHKDILIIDMVNC